MSMLDKRTKGGILHCVVTRDTVIKNIHTGLERWWLRACVILAEDKHLVLSAHMVT